MFDICKLLKTESNTLVWYFGSFSQLKNVLNHLYLAYPLTDIKLFFQLLSLDQFWNIGKQDKLIY